MSNIVEFAKRMKAQREKHGLTQAQLGEKVGLSTQTISAYEKNVSGRGKTPTLDKAIAIADALGVSLDFLCGADPTERECEMGSLRDIVECLFQISRYVPCYSKVHLRGLSEDEILLRNQGLPDDCWEDAARVVELTIDNEILANFFEIKGKLLDLYCDGAFSENLYNDIISGQLANLQNYAIQKKTPWTPDGIRNREDLPK